MTGKKSDASYNAKKTNKNVTKMSMAKINNKENGRINETVLRHRRAQSVGRVADETARETRFKADNPDNPLVYLNLNLNFLINFFVHVHF